MNLTKKERDGANWSLQHLGLSGMIGVLMHYKIKRALKRGSSVCKAVKREKDKGWILPKK